MKRLVNLVIVAGLLAVPALVANGCSSKNAIEPETSSGVKSDAMPQDHSQHGGH